MARNRVGNRSKFGPATRAVHAGEEAHGINGPVLTPITQSATFMFADVAEMKRWAEGRSKADIYTRYGNPTLRVAEEKLAILEGAEAALVTASGMAAISQTILTFAGAGEEIIASRRLYGGTYRLMRDTLPYLGIKVQFVDGELNEVARLVNEKTRILYTESPTNPTLQIVDLRKAAKLARRFKLVSIADNTFATPVFQNPLSFGCDLVVHSATKYLGGHSDVIAGMVAGSAEAIGKIRKTMIALGGSLDPSAGYLLSRGIRTLETRVRRQAESATKIARYLARHPKVERVHYPGLKSHPDHSLARRQMRGFGGMLAFDAKGGLPTARRFCNRIRLFKLAPSLGSVESLAVLPVYTSHHRMSARELADAGVSPGTVRLSIGIEDPADLIADITQALGR